VALRYRRDVRFFGQGKVPSVGILWLVLCRNYCAPIAAGVLRELVTRAKQCRLQRPLLSYRPRFQMVEITTEQKAHGWMLST